MLGQHVAARQQALVEAGNTAEPEAQSVLPGSRRHRVHQAEGERLEHEALAHGKMQVVQADKNFCQTGRCCPFLQAGREAVVMRGRVLFGALICYDDIVAGPSEELRAAGAQALVTITNEAWFGRAELRQHLALAVFRCIETRLPMARCGNDGLTCLIDPAGRVTQAIPVREEGVLVGSLAWTKARPVAPLVRTLVAWTSVALVVAMLLAIQRRKAAS